MIDFRAHVVLLIVTFAVAFLFGMATQLLLLPKDLCNQEATQ